MRQLFTLCLLTFSFHLFSQSGEFDHICGTDIAHQRIIESDPEALDRMMEMDALIKAQAERQLQQANRESSSIMIPVVVHVVYRTSSQNISDEQIESAIEALNLDFNNWNTDLSSVRSAFTASIGNPKIQFCLAQKDPSGNPTNGITRTATSITEWDQLTAETDANFSENVKFLVKGGTNAWNSSKYLNIWVCNLATPILGYAYAPGAAPASRDGIVVNYRRFGTTGIVVSGNLNRTMTHEVGHYLNLPHPWENFVNRCTTHYSATCCTGSYDDGFTDTPPTSGPTYNCPSSNVLCSGKQVQFENFMDYTDDDCSFMFTLEQANAMNACLNSARSSLRLSDAGCSFVGIEDRQPNQSALTFVYPNPAEDRVEVEFRWERGTGDLSVHSLSGQRQLLKTFDENETVELNVSDLPPGLYLMEWKGENGSFSKKLVIH